MQEIVIKFELNQKIKKLIQKFKQHIRKFKYSVAIQRSYIELITNVN